ncbi:hypothetical protein CASFOL_038978 [Castilleja foliolosa]|uniref:Uncharacterized protein n=1 Tax=Castilleja foliolosa TaxID=1961234 RepID=A0ABD3BJM1_9LAMI
MVKKKAPETSAPTSGGSRPKTSTSGKVPNKKVKVSSSHVEADNTKTASSNEAIMKTVRATYAAAILGSEMNIHRERVVSEAKKYYAEKIGSDLIRVDQLLMVRAEGDPL